MRLGQDCVLLQRPVANGMRGLFVWGEMNKLSVRLGEGSGTRARLRRARRVVGCCGQGLLLLLMLL